jgi:hypothetical protein
MKEVNFLRKRDAAAGKIDFVDIALPTYKPEDNAGISFREVSPYRKQLKPGVLACGGECPSVFQPQASDALGMPISLSISPPWPAGFDLRCALSGTDALRQCWTSAACVLLYLSRPWSASTPFYLMAP